MKINDNRILLVDDEPDILELLGYNLTKEGYKTFKAGNGKDAIKIAEEIMPHMIILDLMMPIMDGIEACRELKKIPSLKQCVIIFLTARNDDYSHMAGFDAGADDYIVKPIKPSIFISKINALFRRFEVEEDIINTINIAGLLINRERYGVKKNDKEIVLSKKEFELLWMLAKRPNQIFSRSEIFSNIWGDIIVGSRTIDVHIRRIREKLEIDNIKTIKSVGYKFVC
jgi:two-component system, OmpR family, alkaline phosphatase synthesis response regulator PhoP